MTGKRSIHLKYWLGIVIVLLLVVVSGVVGYLSKKLNSPLPEEIIAAENALFDGNLVSVGLIDVEKLVLLDRYWFGELDPDALPLNDDQKSLMGKLFLGAPRLKENLKQVVFSFNVASDDPPTGGAVLLALGHFDAGELLQTLAENYTFEEVAANRWKLLEEVKPEEENPCEEQDTEKDVKDIYIQITSKWIMLFHEPKQGDQIWQRLISHQAPEQDTASWHQYRQGKLMAFMALIPDKASEVLGGLPGMMAKGAANEAPQVSAAAIGIEAKPMQGGLNVNVHLLSDDEEWIRTTETTVKTKLEEMQKASQSLSPSLAKLISQLDVSKKNGALDIDILLTSQLLTDLDQVVKEGFASLFRIGMSSGDDEEEVEESINTNPSQYSTSTGTGLAPYVFDDNGAPPLFLKEHFLVDLKSLELNKNGVFELWLEGKVAFSGNNGGPGGGKGDLSLSIASVKDSKGQELLRDERCMKSYDLMGRSPNHETTTSSYHHQNSGWVWKHIRLQPDVTPDQIATVEGEISFSAATKVIKFVVPLQAGEAVEYAGLRFYLGGFNKHSVDYQLSGDTERFLELRALNKDGKVLHQSWRMSSPDDGQINQSYKGEVHSLELYLAEEHINSRSPFVLRDLFDVPAKEEKERFVWFAPDGIDGQYWHGLSGLDMGLMKKIPERYQYSGGDKVQQPIAETSQPPVKISVTHKLKKWGSPKIHIYAPVIEDLPGVLSALSYRIDEPAEENGPKVRFTYVFYPHYIPSGEIAAKYEIQGTPMADHSFSLFTGSEENPKMDRLKGEVIFRLPTKTESNILFLKDLWKGQTVDDVTVTITDIDRGIFPGYGLEIVGAVEKLVNLHGISAAGERVATSHVFFREAGSWTMTLPFSKGIEKIEKVELITAIEQEVLRYPFDFKLKYPQE
jgi:hypothetical protein